MQMRTNLHIHESPDWNRSHVSIPSHQTLTHVLGLDTKVFPLLIIISIIYDEPESLDLWERVCGQCPDHRATLESSIKMKWERHSGKCSLPEITKCTKDRLRNFPCLGLTLSQSLSLSPHLSSLSKTWRIFIVFQYYL